MSALAIPFPSTQPPGYTWLEDEPEFDPAKHLALEPPASTTSLREFGYPDEVIATKATKVAVSSPFRILSDEGAAVMLDTARRLRNHAVGCERIENMVRGGCYRSRFLRDLCLDPSVTQIMCDIYQADVAPHTMPVHLGHMNYSPEEAGRAVDKWHHDTLPVDYVMMVTDPATLDGGEFEYFVGTKEEMAELAAQGRTPPKDRVVAPHFPGPGYAIALHGDMVVHRGAPLNTHGERISMVNGYVSTDTSADDQHRHKDLKLVDNPDCLYSEWARHAAWRARGRLDSLIEGLAFSSDKTAIATELESAVEDIRVAVAEIRDDDTITMEHYEKSSTESVASN
ncbi:MAG: hypothetical protein KTR35_24445 [Gammaproteobacteria bacterium]|nr:hypothetical protein [Gammaproteobacteria bacterium]